MKKIAIILAVIMLAACGKREEITPPVSVPVSAFKPMTNDAIIDETHKCEIAGLLAEGIVVSDFGALIVQIQCHPKAG